MLRSAPLALLLAAAACRSPLPRLELEVCVLEDGRATPTWTEGIAVALGREAAEAHERASHPLTPEARAWLGVLEASLPGAAVRAGELARALEVEPIDAVVAAGNRGSSDGFGWVPDSIGINVEAFHEAYGAPDDGALDRMTRIVAHEYIHLLSYAFYPDHRDHRRTPIDRALWTMFFEGIGDFVSVSARWLPAADGSYSATSAATLERLEPVMVERLEALLDATEEEERELRKNICMGKFDRKWGSLPVALWLHTEAMLHGEAEVLHRALRLGPRGVLPLALRHAAPELRPRLERLLAETDVRAE